jgi:CTP:molybdopterin cytidylyltransferase MocA
MIAALVPAAGRSARMGRPKLLLRFGAETLIHRVVTALREGGADRVIVVAPPADVPEGPPVAAAARRAGAEVVVPPARPADMRCSVELGMARLASAHQPVLVAIAPGDTPAITPELVRRLLDTAVSQPGRLVVPCFGAKRGHPLVLPWDLATEIPDLPMGTGINALLRRHADRIVTVEVDDASVAADLNTPEDLERFTTGALRSTCGREDIAAKQGDPDIGDQADPGSSAI